MLTSFHSLIAVQAPEASPTHLHAPRRTLSHTRLSAREQEVLHLIAYEYSSKEIALKLFVSLETIHSHRKNIMVKLNVKNTAGMIRFACEQQLLALQ